MSLLDDFKRDVGKHNGEMAARDRNIKTEKNKFMADLIEQCRTGIEKLQPASEQRQTEAQQMWQQNYGLDRIYGVALNSADEGQRVSFTHNGWYLGNSGTNNNPKQEEIKVNSFFFTVNGLKYTAQEDTPFLTLGRVQEIAGTDLDLAMRDKVNLTKLIKLTDEDYVFPYTDMATTTPYVFFTI